MKQNTTRPTVGLLVSRLTGPYTRGLWPEIVRCVRNAGARLFLFAESSRRRIHDLARELDALIIAAGDLSIFNDGPEMDAFLDSLGPVPRVYLSAPRPDGPCFLVDNRTGVGVAMNHIAFAHGVRDIAFLSGPPGHREADERLAAYRDALGALGAEYRDELLVQGNFGSESGEAALKVLFDERGVKPRAIFCANDVMAQAVVEAAFARGMAVPGELIVVGFDDAIRARTCRVPLTTVRQPFATLAAEAVKAAIAAATGGPPVESRFFPTRLVVRRSCGCGSEGLRGIGLERQDGGKETAPSGGAAWRRAAFERSLSALSESSIQPVDLLKQLSAVVDAYSSDSPSESEFLSALECALNKETASGGRPSLWHRALSAFHNHPYPDEDQAYLRSALLQKARIAVEEAAARERFSPETTREMGLLGTEDILSRLLMDLSFDGLGRLLSEELPRAGIPSAVVSVFEPPPAGGQGPGGEAMLRPLCVYGRDYPGAGAAEPYPARIGFPPGFPQGEAADYIVLSLRHGDEEYGIAFFELGEYPTGLGYEAIARQIGSVLKGILIQDERRAALEALNEANRRLYGLARRDELTGLLNRRGFMEEASRALEHARKQGEPCALFYMDMDGLKRINDSSGHDAGDDALRDLSSVLEESFRSTDAIGRVGGDEFVAMSASGPESAKAILERIASNIALRNAGPPRAFRLSVSIGMAMSLPGAQRDLESMMREADAEAYKEKERKRADGCP